MMASIVQDLRYSLRTLLKSPGFTAVAVLTLAIGIGANTALFSVVDSLLLRPLPFPDSDRVVVLWSKPPDGGIANISPAEFFDYRAQNRVFEHIGALAQAEFNVMIAGAADRLEGFRVSTGFLETLGMRPVLGRGFTAGDDRPGAPRVVMLSYATWRAKFGGEHRIIGQVLTVDGEKATVVGVLPRNFRFIYSPELLVPLAMDEAAASRGDHILPAIAKIKRGVSFEQARQDVETVARTLAQAYPASLKGWSAQIVSLREVVAGSRGDHRDVQVLFGAVAFVLLIACANIANLLLVKAAGRRRELAVRASLGAGRRRLIRQVLTEGAVLALLGGAAGVLLASWLTGLAATLVPAQIVDAISEISLNARVLWFTVAVSLLTGVLFSIPPALRASKLDITSAFKDAGRGSSAGASGRKFRSALVVAEVALSLILLAGAGLMIRSLIALYSSELGLHPEHVVTMLITMPATRYTDAAQVRSFDRALLAGVRALPGVRAAGLSMFLPLEGLSHPVPFRLASHPVAATERPIGRLHFASEGHFETLGMTLRAGRYFTERDNESTPRVAIVNEAFVRGHIKKEAPLGQRLLMGLPVVGSEGVGPEVAWEIVGVVRDVKDPTGYTYPLMYVPAMQWTRPGGALAIRTDLGTAAIVTAVRAVVRSVDPGVPVTKVRGMQEIAMSSVSQPKQHAWLMVAFALVALTMAALGIYGVMSYTVAQRSHELGIRMALGAQPHDLLRMTLRSGLAMAGGGLALGLAGALALTRVLQGLLYNVKATDPLTYAGASVLLLAVALLAAYIPARRAARAEPIVALRCE
ncbi:MAG TPA: ABC transporter permease [Bryobacteraceae bacterium]